MIGKIFHVYPNSADDPALRDHGSTKDIFSFKEYFKTKEWVVDELVAPRQWRDILRVLKNSELTQAQVVFLDFPDSYPQVLSFIRQKAPQATIICRSENAEFLHRLDWARASKGLKLKIAFLGRAFRGLVKDFLCGRTADWILPISDHDALYWKRLVNPLKIKTVPYFLPASHQPSDVIPPYKKNRCACLGAVVMNPLIEDAMVNFNRLVSKLGENLPEWSFEATGVWPRSLQRSPRVAQRGVLNSPFEALWAARAVAILSNYGRGFKTKILEALMAEAYVLVPPALFDRLPSEIQPYCFPVEINSVAGFQAVLKKCESPFPKLNLNGKLRERAFMALDSIFNRGALIQPPENISIPGSVL